MKRIGRDRIASLLMLVVMAIAASCSSDKSAEAEKLLKTVPADADLVALINVDGMLANGGCKVKDGKVTLPAEAQKALAEMPDKNVRSTVESILGGKSGISLTYLSVFNSSRYLMTGLLDDPAAFKAMVEEKSESKFQEEGGAAVCKNIAYIGNQFWIGMPGLPESSELVRYTKLSKDRSMAGHVYADRMLESESVVTGIADLASALGTAGRNRAQISMAMAALFDKATFVGFEGKMKKTSAEIEVKLLNSKGEPSKFLLPTGKIDTKAIGNIGGKAQAVVSGDIPSGLVKKITSIFSSFGGGLPETLTKPLEEVEGTMVFVSGNDGMTGVISTNGTPSPALVELTGEQTRMTVTVDGKQMLLNKGTQPEGPIEVATTADYFKGAMFGAVGIDLFGTSGKEGGYLEGVMVKPEDGSLETEIFVELGQDGWIKLLSELFR